MTPSPATPPSGEQNLGIDKPGGEGSVGSDASVVLQSQVASELSIDVINAWKRADSNAPHVRGTIDTREWDKHLAEVRDQAGFHWREGIFFKRVKSGVVRVTHFTSWNYSANYKVWDIPATEWASIVASVSTEGETLERWNAAQDFHGRELSDLPPVLGAAPEKPPTGPTQALSQTESPSLEDAEKAFESWLTPHGKRLGHDPDWIDIWEPAFEAGAAWQKRRGSDFV